MSKSEEMVPSRDKAEVMKLKVDGASTTVNTIRDQQTARGLSLVCPFPALEVSIPVNFGESGAGDPSRRGTIHRIGVEDDPESGLPRLRLSIRSNDTTRSTVIAAPSEGLLDEASRMTSAPDARTAVDLGQNELYENTAWGELLEEDDEFVDEEMIAEEDIAEESDPIRISPDPAWVGCGELPMPDQMSNRSKTRKRRAAAGIAAWMMVLGFAAGGAYVLKEAGVINLDSARAWFSGVKNADSVADIVIEPEQPILEAIPQAADLEIADAEPAPEDSTMPMEEVTEMDNEFFAEEIQEVPAADVMAPEIMEEDLAVAAVAAVESEVVGAAEAMESVVVEKSAVQSENLDEVTVILPTRWPVEYATAYRLRDPHGVVVDVPGALVMKEGWLEVGEDDEMIRSIKAVQRETGARFVVFINGELPRFMTAPKTGGVALRLYRETPENSVETQQVAMLDN